MKMKITKTKIISIMLIIALFVPHFSFAAIEKTYTRTGGQDLSGTATLKTENTWIDAKYNAESIPVTQSKVHVYDYNTTNEKQIATSEVTYSEANKSKYYLNSSAGAVIANKNLFPDQDRELIYYWINFENGEHEYNDVATFLYEDAIKYNNENYNLKLNIKSIRIKSAESITGIMVLLGSRKIADNNKLDLSTYNEKDVYPFIHAYSGPGKFEAQSGDWMEVGLEYIITDDNGTEIPISGVFGFDDIDYNQGFFIDGIKPNNQGTEKATNFYIKDDNDSSNNEIMYKTLGNGTYIYSSTSENRTDELHDAYALIEDKSKISLNYTFDNWAAGSPIKFSNNLKHYHNIYTSVIGGTIDPNITNIQDKENRTVKYAPNDTTKQYLKSVKIDGNEETITGNEVSYTFQGIVKDHEIAVEYANKLKVSFNPMGGSPTPDEQYVKPNDKATQPTTNPTKNGYKFDGWQNPDGTTPYNFNTPVTEDIELKAKWTPLNYNINYVLNGGANSPENPSKYTVEDTIDFENPTRDGYTFLGWYKDQNFTTPKDGISNETGDVTVYAKWEADKDIPYIVEHYKETDNGEYEKVITDNLTGSTDETVTATPKNYTGFEENKTHENRKATGTVTADGKLVLRLYYDKIEYNVTFDTKGGTPTPEDQVVKYQDKATEPEKEPKKDGYTFKYWYYINEDNEEVRYNFDDPVTEDIELIAKWEEVVATKEDTNTNTITPKTEDTTVAKTVLPKTGAAGSIILVAMGIALFLGVRYFRLKRIMK